MLNKNQIKLIYFLIISAIIGIAFFFYQNRKEIQPSEVEEEREVKSLEETISLAVKNLVPEKFLEKAEYFVDDLNEDGKKEAVIASADIKDLVGEEGYFLVITILNEFGNYEKVGDLILRDNYRGVPLVKEAKDIDNDGEKELFLDLGFGGVSTEAEGVLDADFKEKELGWIEYIDEKGNANEAIFYIGGSVMHQAGYDFQDIDKDGEKELIVENMWGEYEKPENLNFYEKAVPMEEVEGLWWRYEVKVYKFNGSTFAFDEKLTKQKLAEAN